MRVTSRPSLRGVSWARRAGEVVQADLHCFGFRVRRGGGNQESRASQGGRSQASRTRRSFSARSSHPLFSCPLLPPLDVADFPLLLPPLQSYVPLSNRSATPEVSPAAAADDSKPSKDTKDKEPEGPIKKFTFSPEMKRLLWQLHLCIVQTLDHLNDIAKYTNPSAPDVGLTSANKQLYADVSRVDAREFFVPVRSLSVLMGSSFPLFRRQLVHCFPAGYMTTTNLSRARKALLSSPFSLRSRSSFSLNSPSLSISFCLRLCSIRPQRRRQKAPGRRREDQGRARTSSECQPCRRICWRGDAQRAE